MSKLITKERVVSGGIGAALLGVGYGIWRHLHPEHGRHVLYAEDERENDRGEYGHHKHKHHHKDH